jgi:nucleoside-diphosphate-sugar epimerase
MKMLVTGGSGFTGRRVIEELIGRGHEVVAIARSSVAAERIEKLGAAAIFADLDQAGSLLPAFSEAGADVLVNVASLGFGHAQVIVDAAKGAGLRHGVFVSTTSIFTKLNARTKPIRTDAERRVMDSGLNVVLIRPTMIYGLPGDRNMERLIALVAKSSTVPLPGGGHGLQQPVHVLDLAKGIAAASERVLMKQGAYNLAGPEPLALRNVVEITGRALNKQVRIVPIPERLIRAAVACHERMPGKTRISTEQIDRVREDKVFDNGPAQHDLGFESRSFSEGITAEVSLCRP